MKFEARMLPTFLLFGISAASFVFGVWMGFMGDYQESVFLFGVGFLVLAFALFAYRMVKFPDARKG